MSGTTKAFDAGSLCATLHDLVPILSVPEIKSRFFDLYANCETIEDVLDTGFPTDIERILREMARRIQQKNSSGSRASTRNIHLLLLALLTSKPVITQKRRRLV